MFCLVLIHPNLEQIVAYVTLYKAAAKERGQIKYVLHFFEILILLNAFLSIQHNHNKHKDKNTPFIQSMFWSHLQLNTPLREGTALTALSRDKRSVRLLHYTAITINGPLLVKIETHFLFFLSLFIFSLCSRNYRLLQEGDVFMPGS